jgi:hypothetical protein
VSQSAEVVSTPSDETSDSWCVGAGLDEAEEDLRGEAAGGRTAMKKWVSKRRGRRVGVLQVFGRKHPSVRKTSGFLFEAD